VSGAVAWEIVARILMVLHLLVGAIWTVLPLRPTL
jgi:hypothetical protein